MSGARRPATRERLPTTAAAAASSCDGSNAGSCASVDAATTTHRIRRRRRALMHTLLLVLCAATALHTHADTLSPALGPHSEAVVDQLQPSMRLLSLRSSAADPVGCNVLHPPDLTDPHLSFAFIPREGTLPDCRYFSRAIEIEYVGDDAHFPGNRFFAVRYGNGSVELWVRDPLSAGGIVEDYVPTMVSGPFEQMAAGDEHLVLLRSDGTVTCRAIPGFDNSTGALFEARAAVVYKQIAAAALFTCGVRANDSHVECFGSTAVGGPVHLPSSVRSYSVIAASTPGGFCGLAQSDGNLYCWTIQGASEDFPALDSADSPAPFAKPVWTGTSTQACAIMTTGIVTCLSSNPLVIDLSQQTPLDQATIQGGHMQGAARDDYRAISYMLDGEHAAGDYIFTPMRFIGVDPVHGNDTLCNCVRTIVASELASFVACRTIAGAVARVAFPNTWIQLLPGVHVAPLLAVDYASVTFSSQPPVVFSAAELSSVAGGAWAARMAATVGQTTVWDCTGSIHCLTGQLHELTVSGLTFVGSEQHAISHAAPAVLPFVAVTIADCKFTRSGGMLINTDGLVVIQRCEVFEPVASLAVEALLHVEDSALTMSDSHFHSVLFLDAEFRMRSTVFVRTLNRAVRVSIRNCTFEDIESGTTTDVETSYIGGAALQIITAATTVELADCIFRRVSTRCPYCFGGAVAIGVPTGSPSDPETIATVTIANCSFHDLRVPTPASVSSQYLFFADGAGVWIGGLLAGGSTMTVAMDVVLADLRFERIFAVGNGAAIFLGILRSLTIDRVSVIDSVAVSNGGALTLEHSPGVAFGFAQLDFEINDLTCTNTTAQSWGGCVFISNVPARVRFSRLRVSGSVGFQGGGVYSDRNVYVEFVDSEFGNCSAIEGGAVYALDTTNIALNECHLQHCTATRSGGAVSAQFTSLQLRASVFEDCSLSNATTAAGDVFSRVGGAVRLTGGSLFSTRSRFSRCSALPNDLQLSSCAASWDSHTGLCVVGLGGALSAELSSVSLSDTNFDAISSCSGALHFRGGSNSLFASVASGLTAHSAAFMAVDSVTQIKSGEVILSDATSIIAGGSFVFFQCFAVILDLLWLSRSTCTHGDGGAFWTSSVRANSIAITRANFVNVSAPMGSGGILFTLLETTGDAAIANTLLRLDAVPSNAFNLSGDVALYGRIQGSSIVSLRPSVSSLTVYPNQPLSDVSLPSLNVTALDAYHQAISMDRALVVRVRAIGATNAADPVAAAAQALLVLFSGTTLQEVRADSGVAVFSGDLSIAAPPGVYTLLFSVVSRPAISATTQLTVLNTCPPSRYYSIASRSCIPCASRTLVYDVASNDCVRCPAGWQRTEANDASGPLADGVSCALCPLGQVSTEGSVCAPCGPNTYQPTPSSACVACSSVSGLLCAGDGLAQVQEGYFALAVDTASGSQIATFQCPSSFCTSALVQQTAVNGSFASAVSSFGQCAFPRLASPTNLLCGECAEGYRPWGNRCTRCDSPNVGLLFLVFLGSLLLVGWLLRSALGSSSAGHAVVVLYFVQTAMLELGTINRLLSWLNFTLFSPNTTTDCIAPLSPYQQVQAQILMPVALGCELMLVGVCHWIASLRWGAIAASEASRPLSQSAGSPLSVRLRVGVLRFISLWSVDIYIAATISLLLFAYTQVCAASLTYLQCVDVGGSRVVFSQPAMYCDSSAYKQTQGLVIAALVLYIAGLPVAIAIFLTARKKDVADAYLLMDARANARDRAREQAAVTGAAIAPTLHVSLVSSPTSRFVCRYAPLFAMYSSSAWFWQLFVVSRRVCFVCLAVLLVRDPAQKYFAFSLAHIMSMLVQMAVQPFRMAAFNQAEFASHVLLILISITLTAHPHAQQQSRGPEIFIFLMVVPPLLIYALWAIRGQITSASQARADLWAKRMSEQAQAEDALMRQNPMMIEMQLPAGAGLSSGPRDEFDGAIHPAARAALRPSSPSSRRPVSPHAVGLSLPDHTLSDPRSPSGHSAAL